MDQICDHCSVRMYVTRKSPHPTLWPGRIIAIYECPKCGQLRECIENGKVECVDVDS